MCVSKNHYHGFRTHIFFWIQNNQRMFTLFFVDRIKDKELIKR
jgi:hypothetical protein